MTGSIPESAPLPPELIQAIAHQQYACVTAPTERGTVYVVKAPGQEIESLRGRVPILVRHELHHHPQAPVIRTVLMLFDQPQRPMALETFINVDDPQQRQDFAALARQKELELLFYDEGLAHRLSKRLRHRAPQTVTQVLAQADRLLAAIPREHLDFDRAKLAVMRRVGWPPTS